MPKISANLYIVSRISSVKKSVNVKFEQRRAATSAKARTGRAKSKASDVKDPNHLLIGLYSPKSAYYGLLHGGSLETPVKIPITMGAGGKPSPSQMRAAALDWLQTKFSDVSLGALPTTSSYWTGTYWFRPKSDQYAAGFQVLDDEGDPIEGILNIRTTTGAEALLRMDFVVMVQGS
jgi:hypothetical protein